MVRVEIEQPSAYVAREILPELSPALAALARARPEDARTWLAEYLLAHKKPLPPTPSAPSVASFVAPATATMPPGRVRRMFKSLDKDASGGLSETELLKGFAAEFEVATRPYVTAKIREVFAKVATPDVAGGNSLKPGLFSRFYCEVIFHHFDANENGTLQLAEAQAALAYLVKPDTNGAQQSQLVAAFSPHFTDDTTGEVRLPIQWFWKLFSAME